MLPSYALQEARRIARQELDDEEMRRLIDEEKARLRNKAATKFIGHRLAVFFINIVKAIKK